MAFLAHPQLELLWLTISSATLMWSAILFGRSLFRGSTPLIERIARLSHPDLSPPVARYTRFLTTIWFAYLLLALAAQCVLFAAGLNGAYAIWFGAVALFLVEHRARRLIFPKETFPGLLDQLMDTLRIFRGLK